MVWSYGEKKLICMADAHAESGKKLHTLKGGVKSSKDLDDHLTGNAVRMGIEGLKVIDFDAKAPPATAPGAEPAPGVEPAPAVDGAVKPAPTEATKSPPAEPKP